MQKINTLSSRLKESHLINILFTIGLGGFIKNFLAFSFYGFFAVILIYILYGLEGELSSTYKSILEGPIAIPTFIVTLIFSLVLLLALSKMGKVKCDFFNKKPKRIFFIALPFCEVSISVGVVICAALFGLALGLNFISLWNDTAKQLYPTFYTGSLFIALFIYSVSIMIVSILDKENKAIKQTTIPSIIHIVIAASYLYFNLPFKELIFMSVMLLILCMALPIYNHLIRDK